MKVKMNVTNADLKVGTVKINSISASSIVILGDAESFVPVNVSVTRGTTFPTPLPATISGGTGR